jgi:hypothetical protein
MNMNTHLHSVLRLNLIRAHERLLVKGVNLTSLGTINNEVKCILEYVNESCFIVIT